jgi:hypothetical protein
MHVCTPVIFEDVAHPPVFFKFQAAQPMRCSLGLHTGISAAHSKHTEQQAGDPEGGGLVGGLGGGVLPRPVASL